MTIFHRTRQIALAAVGAALLLGASIVGVLAYPEPLYPYHSERGRLSLLRWMPWLAVAAPSP